jgi:hypothetical protein
MTTKKPATTKKDETPSEELPKLVAVEETGETDVHRAEAVGYPNLVVKKSKDD